MPKNSSRLSDASSDFDAVWGEIIRKEEQGQTIDIEHYCQSFPPLAKKLRANWRYHLQFKRKAGRLTPTVPGRAEQPALPDLGPGRQFACYEIVREMGHGAMGVVYLARQQKIMADQRKVTRLVALKLIRRDRLEHLSSEQRRRWLDRFCNEAKAVARVNHDRVVTVYAFGSHGGNPFYAMHYVEGQSLGDMIKDGPLPNRKAAILMEQVARAVQACHDGEVFHRDLKPHNILVDTQGRPYVTDFGLAKCADAEESLTQTGEILGSPAYMSPEQAQDSSKVTAATDVYGLGATLYALLTGRPPFSGKTLVETLDHVKNREPVPPRQLNPAVDLDLNVITLRCLEKEPGRRVRNAAALADALQCYLEGRPIPYRLVTPPERLWRWCRRKPVLATISAAALLLLMLSATLYFALSSKSGKLDEAELAYKTAAERADRGDKAQQVVTDINAVVNEFEDQFEQNRQPGDQLVEPNQKIPKEQLQPPKELELPKRVKDRLVEGKKAEADKRALDYLDDMHRVQKYFDGGDPAGAREILAKWRESPYRAWEWHFAAAQLRDAGFPLSGQKSQAHAAGSAEGFTFPAGTAGHRREVLAVAISPDGTRLASADAEGIVKIWDLTDKSKKPRKLTAVGRVTALAWSVDGKRLAAACQGSPFSGSPSPSPVPPANGLPPTANGQPNQGQRPPAKQAGRFERGSGVVIIWDAATGKQPVRTLYQAADINLPSGLAPLSTLPENPTKEQMAAQLARQEADNSRSYLSRYSWTASLIWCPNRKLVLADGDGKIQIWDLSTNKKDPFPVLPAHDGGVHSVALSPDGNRLASVSYDGVIKIWDLATTAKKPLTLQIPPREKFNFDPTYALVWTSEGKCLSVVSRYGEVREVDVEAQRVGQPRKLIPRDPNVEWAMGGVGTRGERFVWSPDAKLLVSLQSGGQLKIWDAATGKEGLSMAAPGAGPGMLMARATCAPAWDPSGLRLVMGGGNGTIQAWPVVLRRQAVRTPNIPGAVGWSADSRFLLGIHVYSSAEDETLIEQRKMGEEAIKLMQENFQRNGGGLSPPDPRLMELQKRGGSRGTRHCANPGRQSKCSIPLAARWSALSATRLIRTLPRRVCWSPAPMGNG
jgi:serine/threonine protein kinase/WD40 repeat protein